jgi:methyl-accepting chemotaxis protein
MIKVEQNAMNINKTLRKIENIVGQTTTLAVSGNIEAARAGEFGKGFAVVSSDIRNLAIDAGANIDKIIDTMNILDSEVANIIRDWGIAVAEQEAEKSQLLNVTDELKIVAKDTEKVITLLDSLSAYADENLTALEQARTGSEQITTAAGQAMSNSAESKSAAELIQNTVGRMNELVEELAVAADELQRG